MSATLGTGAASSDGAPAGRGRPTVSVVIPAYNEEAAVRLTVEQVRSVLDRHETSHDLIVVNDGSSDRTLEEARQSGARVVHFPDNMGYGHALKAGIAASDSELVAILDADGTYPAEALPAMISLALRADMVVGDRGRSMNNVPWVRRPAKWLLKVLASVLARRRIDDVNSGLRVFRRAALQPFVPLLPDGYSFTTTITLCMLASDRPVIYHPIHYGVRIGHSKIRARHFFKFVFLVVRLTLIFQPLRIFLPLSAMLIALGGAVAIYRGAPLHPPAASLVAAVLGVIAALVGFLADRTARIRSRDLRAGEPSRASR